MWFVPFRLCAFCNVHSTCMLNMEAKYCCSNNTHYTVRMLQLHIRVACPLGSPTGSLLADPLLSQQALQFFPSPQRTEINQWGATSEPTHTHRAEKSSRKVIVYGQIKIQTNKACPVYLCFLYMRKTLMVRVSALFLSFKVNMHGLIVLTHFMYSIEVTDHWKEAIKKSNKFDLYISHSS